MGSTYVSITKAPGTGLAPGFWMSDSILELWLRLLALHLPLIDDSEAQNMMIEIRNDWLLASSGIFSGCVPHGLEYVCETAVGQSIVRQAIDSLMAALNESTAPMDCQTLNLLGIGGGTYSVDLDRSLLMDIGHAFLDLFDGKITQSYDPRKVMPGSPHRLYSKIKH